MTGSPNLKAQSFEYNCSGSLLPLHRSSTRRISIVDRIMSLNCRRGHLTKGQLTALHARNLIQKENEVAEVAKNELDELKEQRQLHGIRVEENDKYVLEEKFDISYGGKFFDKLR